MTACLSIKVLYTLYLIFTTTLWSKCLYFTDGETEAQSHRASEWGVRNQPCNAWVKTDEPVQQTGIAESLEKKSHHFDSSCFINSHPVHAMLLDHCDQSAHTITCIDFSTSSCIISNVWWYLCWLLNVLGTLVFWVTPLGIHLLHVLKHLTLCHPLSSPLGRVWVLNTLM